VTRDSGLLELAERFVDLNLRDFTARHGPGGATPLTAAEHLDLLATAEAIRRHVRYGRQSAVRRAREAGATWPAIAAATGTDAATTRGEFLDWIDGQAALWDHLAAEGRPPIGLSPAQRTAARDLVDDPTPTAHSRRKEAPTPR
jgi:hypothetical protein